VDFSEIGEHLAAQSGWSVVLSTDDELQVRVALGEGRTQTVRIATVGKFDAQGIRSDVLEFASIAVEVPRGQMIPPKLALELLRANARMLFGAWGIGERNGQQFLALYESALVETLNPEELLTAVTVLATEADRLEKEWGGGDVW
jgi:hypothetical protein